MDTCVHHPQRPAIEQCEVCRRAVCEACLWYAESGERLCPEHGRAWLAEDRAVHPPERYAEGARRHDEAALPPSPVNRVPYQGNSIDMAALIAAVVGVANLAACAGLGALLPIVAFLLGLVGWLQGSGAVDRSRTRALSGVGMLSGGVFILGAFAFFTLCAVCWMLSIGLAGSASGGIRTFPTPGP